MELLLCFSQSTYRSIEAGSFKMASVILSLYSSLICLPYQCMPKRMKVYMSHSKNFYTIFFFSSIEPTVIEQPGLSFRMLSYLLMCTTETWSGFKNCIQFCILLLGRCTKNFGCFTVYYVNNCCLSYEDVKVSHQGNSYVLPIFIFLVSGLLNCGILRSKVGPSPHTHTHTLNIIMYSCFITLLSIYWILLLWVYLA